MTPEEFAIEIQKTFEKLKKFNPDFVSISIGGVSTGSGDVEVEILNEDPSLPDDSPDCAIVEIFSYDADVSVIDAGIGSYEFWGAKGNDTHMQNEIQSFKMTDNWPVELKWLEEIIAEKVCEAISELDPGDNDGDRYCGDERDDYDDRY